MKNIKLTDLSAGTCYINFSALLSVAQIAMTATRNDIEDTLRENADSLRNGKGVMPCKIEGLKYQVETLQKANQVLYALQQTTDAKSSFDEPSAPIQKRELHIVRDDITVPDGFYLLGEFYTIIKGDLQWNCENNNWVEVPWINGYVGDEIVIRKIAKDVKK